MADETQPKIPSKTRKLIRDLRKMAAGGDDLALGMADDIETSYLRFHPWKGTLQELEWIAAHGQEDDRPYATFLLKKLKSQQSASSSDGRPSNKTRAEYERVLKQLKEETLIITIPESCKKWAEFLTIQYRQKKVKDRSVHAEDAVRIRRALGTLRKRWSDNPKDERFNLATFVGEQHAQQDEMDIARVLDGQRSEPSAKSPPISFSVAMALPDIGRALGGMEQKLLSAEKLFDKEFNQDLYARTDHAHAPTLHRAVIMWVLPYPLPPRLHPSFITLEKDASSWVKRQQQKIVIGAAVPERKHLIKVMKEDEFFRDNVIPNTIVHNQMLILYGKMLRDINFIGKALLAEAGDALTESVLAELRILHELIREARESI